jgi:hypothetical protein
MAAKNTAVFGIYASRPAVEEAEAQFVRAGFRPVDVSVLYPGNQGTQDFGHEKHTKAPEGFVAGAIAGAVVGAILGYLIGTGIIAIPQLTAMEAGGPVVFTLAAALVVAVLGGAIGALSGMAVPEYEAKRFAGRIRKGGILASVHCDDGLWVKRAKDIMEVTGAHNIATAQQKRGDFANADKPSVRLHPDSDLSHTL